MDFRHTLAGFHRIDAIVEHGTPFVVMAERVIAIRGHEQVVPVPEGHRRTQSILSQKANSGCYLVGRNAGGMGYASGTLTHLKRLGLGKLTALRVDHCGGCVQSAHWSVLTL